jgi:hypothetical protein
MASAASRSHDEHLPPVSLRRNYVLATELELRGAQGMSETSGDPEDDDRRNVAAKLVNIAQPLDISGSGIPPKGLGTSQLKRKQLEHLTEPR